MTMTTTTDPTHERFQALVRDHQKIVFKVANVYCRHAEDRRDLEQAILTQLWRAFPRYDETRPFSTWMYRVALNVAISFARQARRHPITLDDQPLARIESRDAALELDDPGSLQAQEQLEALRRCLDRLDGLDRALMLLYLEERGYREIAEVLGISETNVATKISRLKQKIRRDLLADEIN